MAFVPLESEVMPPCEGVGLTDITHRGYEPVWMDLLPRGPAWSPADENLVRLRGAFATEPSRIARAVWVLERETDPARTQLLLDEWELTYGLPECPGAVPSSDDMRRKVLALKVKALIGAEKNYAWWLASLGVLGADLLWWLGGLEVMTCIDDCVDPIADDEWPFVGWLGFQYDGADLAVIECFAQGAKLGGTKLTVYEPWTLALNAVAVQLRGVTGTIGGYVVAVGDGGQIRRSTTDWSTWTTPTAPVGTGHLRAVAAGGVMGSTLFTVGEPDIGTLISVDWGETWEVSKLTGTAELYGVCRGPDDVFVAVGAGETWRTTDASNWSSVAPPTGATLRGVARGEGFIVAVGDSGTVIRSVTDGASWAAVSTPAGTTALAACAAWGDVAVAVGAGGFAIRSDDRGLSWAVVASATTANLAGVTASKHGRWSAVGAGGVVVQSFDDGLTWQSMTSPTAAALRAVADRSPDGLAVAVGDEVIIKE